MPLFFKCKSYWTVLFSSGKWYEFLCVHPVFIFITVSQFYLIDFLHLYPHRGLIDLRCIVFVERVITAIALCRLLNVVLPSLSGWRTEYLAGSNTRLQLQSRKAQNIIVEEFRKGKVSIMCNVHSFVKYIFLVNCFYVHQ